MKKSLFFIATLVILITLFLMEQKGTTLSESQAVELVKNAHPEFRGYPSDGLPPRSIRTEQKGDSWYVAFVQEGSGRPIISARCFLVSTDESISDIGEYSP